MGYPAGSYRNRCSDLPGFSAGKRSSTDYPDSDQLHLLYAVQYLPPGGRYPNGHHLLHQSHKAGGYRYYKIYTSSPGTAFPSAKAADSHRNAGFLCPGRCSFYFSLPFLSGKGHLVFSYTSRYCPGRPALCRSGKGKRTAGPDPTGTLTKKSVSSFLLF